MSVKVIGEALRELLQPFENNIPEGLLHLLVVADELTLRHIHLPGMRADGAGVPGLAVGARMGADGYGKLAALVVQGCVREIGSEHHSHTPDHRANGAAHRPGNDKDRTLAALARLADFGSHPPLAEETLLAEIVLEHFREFDAGIAENIVINVAGHRCGVSRRGCRKGVRADRVSPAYGRTCPLFW